jgi:N-acetylmuramoyl-L-alanine amidase
MLGLALAAVSAASLAAGTPRSAASDVVGVRLGGDATETRIVLDLRRAASLQVDQDANAQKGLRLTLSGVTAGRAQRGDGYGIVKSWTLADGGGGARLALTFSQPGRLQRRFLLPPADGVANYRYVIDIAAQAAPAAAPVQGASLATPTRLQPTTKAPPTSHHRKVIVLDPGHGGKDPGAGGAVSHEKDVTLAAAKALKVQLERTGRYQVVMTRDSDVFVPLEQRVQIARRAGADLFLSLHADSGASPSTQGASVYTLSDRGTARVGYVLDRRDWFLQPTVSRGDHAVSQILLDLSQRSTRNRSAEFAQALIARVGDRAPLLERSRRDADYFVLLAPDVPAVLLEMGFITNPDDETRLNDPKARSALADEIAGAIDAYFAAPARLAQR